MKFDQVTIFTGGVPMNFAIKSGMGRALRQAIGIGGRTWTIHTTDDDEVILNLDAIPAYIIKEDLDVGRKHNDNSAA